MMEQIKEDHQKSKASQDSPSTEDKTSKFVLSDADYEFLFNQLLEGVAHGWHERKIVKFFERLGDRGKQENWVAWLERLRSKIITLPVQSKRQLGTVMIRLGELTQSAAAVSQIGTVSNSIGRELLFGNTEDVVWEYVGPDLSLDPPTISLETAEDISERLPTDFAELASVGDIQDEASTNKPSEIQSIEEAPVIPSPWDDDSSEYSLKSSVEPELSSIEVEEDLLVEPELPSIEVEADLSVEPELSSIEVEEDLSIKSESNHTTAIDSSEANNNTYNDEFEFELEKFELEQQDKSFSSVELASELDSSPKEELPVEKLPVEEVLKPDPVAIDLDRVMDLIEQDEDLAQEISQKLNVSLTNKRDSPSELTSDLPSIDPVNLDRSSVDLIEGWFNLGLKQVSGGEFDNAIASWEKALKINPNLSEAWHNRGSALGRLGKYKEAVESFQKALAIDPHNYQAWNDRAHALYQLQNWAAAADSWSNALKITPGNHLFWYNRGCALEQLESWAESISSYEKSLEIKPDFQPARSRYTNLVADNSRSN